MNSSKKVLKLINDERTLLSVRKAIGCTGGATDEGCYPSDYAECTDGATDYACTNDLAACSDGAEDLPCLQKDETACSGTGEFDFWR